MFQANLQYAWNINNPNRSQHWKNITLYAIQGNAVLVNQRTSQDYVAAIKETRSRIDACSNTPTQNVERKGERWSYMTGYTFQFYSQFLDVRNDLYKICGFATLGVALVTLLFQCSLRCSLIMSAIVIMVSFEVATLIAVIPGLKINAFSLVNICISIGMGIEFSAHIVHHFLITEGDTKNERVLASLAFMGPPMVHGAVTSLIATLFLAWSDVTFIRSYYFGMFFDFVVVAAPNGLVLLPVLLSLFGDNTVAIPKHERKKRQTVKVCCILC